MEFTDNLDKLVHDMNKYIQYLNDLSDQNYKNGWKYNNKTRTEYYAGDYNTGVRFRAIQVDVSKNDITFDVDVRPTFNTSVKEEISIFFNHFRINDLDNIEHFAIKDGPWYRAYITINKDSLIKQAKQYFGEAIIPILKWKVYNIEDIGPLIAVGRWNGGRIAFKYSKKTNEFVIEEYIFVLMIHRNLL